MTVAFVIAAFVAHGHNNKDSSFTLCRFEGAHKLAGDMAVKFILPLLANLNYYYEEARSMVNCLWEGAISPLANG